VGGSVGGYKERAGRGEVVKQRRSSAVRRLTQLQHWRVGCITIGIITLVETGDGHLVSLDTQNPTICVQIAYKVTRH